MLRGPCVGPHAEQLLAVKLHYRAKARCAAEAVLDMEPDPPCWYCPQAASSGYALQPLHRRYAMQHARVSNLMPVCWRLQGWFLRQGLDFGANFVLYRGHPADVSRHCPLAAPSTPPPLHTPGPLTSQRTRFTKRPRHRYLYQLSALHMT